MLEIKAKVRDHVIFVDSLGRPHDALITGMGDPKWHAEMNREPWVNLIIISDDENRSDSYGRQTERFTSVSYKAGTQAHGQYWMYPGEEPNPIVEVHS